MKFLKPTDRQLLLVAIYWEIGFCGEFDSEEVQGVPAVEPIPGLSRNGLNWASKLSVSKRNENLYSALYTNCDSVHEFLTSNWICKARFRRRTFHEPNLIRWKSRRLKQFGTPVSIWNVFCKHFEQNEYFPPFEFSSAGVKTGVWINSAGLNNLGRP